MESVKEVYILLLLDFFLSGFKKMDFKNIDFNDFLRIMSAILIVLLVFQGCDYMLGFGVNNYLFVIFCITFAFTMGGIYYNILLEKQKKMNEDYNMMVHEVLISIKDEGLNDDNIDELEELLLSSERLANNGEEV